MEPYEPRSAAERRFLESYDPSRFPRPSVTVDTVVIRRGARTLEVLLIRRGGFPYKGKWALPGGFLDVETDHDLLAGAARELAEETGIGGQTLVPVGCFGRAGRDPRTRTVTAAFLCVAAGALEVEGRDDAVDARWFSVCLEPNGLTSVRRRGQELSLAFDHDEIIGTALVELRRRAEAARAFLDVLQPSWTVAEASALVALATGPRR